MSSLSLISCIKMLNLDPNFVIHYLFKQDYEKNIYKKKDEQDQK